MKNTRREFLLKSAMGAGLITGGLSSCQAEPVASDQGLNERYRKLDELLARPVLKSELFTDPVIIESLELLRYDNNFICRVRSTDGAEGISVGNNAQLISLYPIFVNRLQPFFIGKDARNLEQLLDEVYVYKSNYKVQNLALWVPLATIEFAILDLLGRMAGKSIGELIGEIFNPKVAVYRANNYRAKLHWNPSKGSNRMLKKLRPRH